MNDIKTKLDILINILDKKIELLEQTHSITLKQEFFHKSLEGNDKITMLSEATSEKQKIIDEIIGLDDAFLSIFRTFNGILNSKKELYKAEIKTMQQKIEQITDIDVKIRLLEERNRITMQRALNSSKKINTLKASKNYILNQYAKNKRR